MKCVFIMYIKYLVVSRQHIIAQVQSKILAARYLKIVLTSSHIERFWLGQKIIK